MKFLHHPTGTTKLTNDHHMSELKQKKLHGVFFVHQKEIPQVDLEQSNKWLTKGSLSGGTEAAL
eukprot:3386226-Ditylum_brightwellii.AAC.1